MSGRKGFSLVELSIVLVIIGLMLAGSASLFSITQEYAKVKTTNEILDAIERALVLHYRTVGDLPCPADPTNPLSDADFARSEEATPAIGTCTDYTTVASAAGGFVPVRTLNLPDSYGFDGWGNRITYIIDDDCDDTDDFPNACIQANASLVMQDNNGNTRPNNAVVALISHGKNGLGAYKRNGGVPTAATAANETENTDGDVNLRDDFIRDWDGVGATYFDDIVRWKVPAQITFEE